MPVCFVLGFERSIMLTLAEKFILDTCIELMDWVTKPPNVKGTHFDTYTGICPNINIKFNNLTPNDADFFFNLNYIEIKKTLQQICEDWPKFSGDSLFPVPVPGNLIYKYLYTVSPIADIYFREKDKYAGSYGELRLELLQFIIDTLKNLKK